MRPALGVYGAPWIWLLDLDWPQGEVGTRLSSSPVVIEDSDGVARQYRGGLPRIVWRSEVPLYEVSTSVRSLALEVDLGDQVATLEARGLTLEGARATLRRWRQGMTWRQRQLFLEGRVRGVQLGTPGERVRFDLVEEEFEDRAILWPAPVITAAAFPTADSSAIGQPIPRVYGAPGVYRSASGQVLHAGSRPERIDFLSMSRDYLLISGGEVAANEVTVTNTDDDTTDTLTVSTATVTLDGVGYVYSYVDVLTSGLITEAPIDTNPYVVSWSEGCGAKLSPRAPLHDGGGYLVRYLLSRSTLRVDRGSVQTAVNQLNRYRFGTYVDAKIRPWDLLRTMILPLLPVSITPGPEGLRLIVWRPDARAHEAVYHLEEGRNASLASFREAIDVELVTAAEVSYAPDDVTGDFADTVKIYPRGSAGLRRASTRFAAAAAADQARSLGEGVPERVALVEADAVHDTGTAYLIGMDCVRRGWRAPELVTWDVDEEGAGLEEGDVVLVTSASFGWTQQVGQVQAIELDGATARVTVVRAVDPFTA